MVFLLLFLSILILFHMKFPSGNELYFKDYMSYDKTTSIKGIFVILVFLRHLSGYIVNGNKYDILLFKFQNFWGQTIVVMFLFYSGYGIFKSICNKNEYLNKIPTNRIIKTLINFDIAIILYCLMNTFLGNKYSLWTIFTSFLVWNGIGNSGWFIFAILMMYIITYISFKIFKNNIKVLICATLLTVIYIIIMYFLKGDVHWFDTVISYVGGMWFALYNDKFEKVLLKNKHTYLLSLLFSIIITILMIKYTNHFLSVQNRFAYTITNELNSILFAITTIIITMKCSIHNKILNWFGRYVFSVYILQRIPMITLQHYKINQVNTYLYFILCFVITLILAIMFEYIMNRINRKIFS